MFIEKSVELIKDPVILSVDFKPGRDALKKSIEELNLACDQLEGHGQNAILVLKLGEFKSNELRIEPSAKACELDIYLINKWEKVLRRIETQDFITISCCVGNINGYALSVLATTDYRIAHEKCQFSLKDEQGEIMPGMIIHRLTQQIGHAKARKLVLWGETTNSEQAIQDGIVDLLVSDIDDGISDFVSNLDYCSGRDLAVRRRLMNEAVSTSYEEALGTHLAASDRFLREK